MLPAALMNKLREAGLVAMTAMPDREAERELEKARHEKKLYEARLMESYAQNVKTMKDVKELMDKRIQIQNEQTEHDIGLYKQRVAELQKEINDQRELIIKINADRLKALRKAGSQTMKPLLLPIDQPPDQQNESRLSPENPPGPPVSPTSGHSESKSEVPEPEVKSEIKPRRAKKWHTMKTSASKKAKIALTKKTTAPADRPKWR